MTSNPGSSREMEAAAHEGGLDFNYMPVPHGEIPEQAVARLRTVLDHQHGQVLLYCRTLLEPANRVAQIDREPNREKCD